MTVVVDLLVRYGLVMFLLLVVASYFRTELFRCPECGMRNDYDHIAKIDDEAPYCPYCGTHTDYVGTKWYAWKAKLLREELEAVRPAGEEGDAR